MHCFLLTFIFSSWYFVFWNITICLLRTAYYDTSYYSMFVQIAGKKMLFYRYLSSQLPLMMLTQHLHLIFQFCRFMTF